MVGVGRTVDEVISSRLKGLQAARIPLREHLTNGGVIEARAPFHYLVGFGDELHQAVFNAVVDHLHEVASGSGPN